MEDARTGARDVPVDRRASDLELQLEQVQLTLQQLRQTHGSLQEMETRLGDMTRECAEILDRWAKNDEKHATAVVELHGRLSEWNDIERRLLSESATRVHQFERSLQHEWNALRQKHEAPMQQLETQAARIAETCVNAVDQALRGFDRAEARLAALEEKLEREMGQLAGEVRGALAELRETQALGTRQPWSLDNVVRLHNELRGDDRASDAPAPLVASAAGTVGLVQTARVPRVVEAIHDEPDAPHDARLATADDGPASHAMLAEPMVSPARAIPAWWAAALVLVAAGLVGYGLYMGSEFSAGLRDATARAEAAEREAAASRTQARDEIAAVRHAADERLATAQQAATSAQRLASIVAAPDSKRFDLVAQDATTPSAQLLWSRTHGLAFSAAALPAPPAGWAYQLWLVTRTTPASVGVVVPAADGPTSVVFPWPADLRRVVIGATVTIEPSGGSPRPTGAVALTSRIAPATGSAPAPAPPAGS
jgi:hypothetical protein